MADISLQISAYTLSTALPNGVATPTNIGTFIGNNFATLNNYQNYLNTDFTSALYGHESSSYYFTSNQQFVLTTPNATYTFTGPNAEAQIAVGLAAGQGQVNLTSVTISIPSLGAMYTESGNVTLTANSSGWYLNGSVANETLTVSQAYSVLNGTKDTISISGSINYTNGSTTSAVVNSETVSSNGLNASSNVTGNISLTPIGTGFAISGNVTGASSQFSNGDYIDITNANIPAGSNFSLGALPSGGNVITGTYPAGLTINGGSGNDTVAAGNGTTTINGGGGTDTVTFKAAASNYTIIPEANGTWIISSSSTGEGPDTLSGVTYASFSDGSTLDLATSTWNSGTSFATPTSVAGLNSLPTAGEVSIVDTAANVASAINSIESLVSAGRVASIKLTDNGIPTLSLTASQVANDNTALKSIAGLFDLSITAPASSATITGLTGDANMVIMPGASTEYMVAAAGDGATFTVSGDGLTDQISHVQALKFSDFADIVASQTPPQAGAISSAQITELYGAVFGRTPDIAGLSYYQNLATTNPSTPFLQYALNFLASPEYANNPAHGYAQTAAGDAQFIIDSYQNLLHRVPGSGDAAWYQANVINPILGNATPGTAAYTQAEALAHAQVLVDFSASAEFLNDVQITARNPTSAQHWLLLI